jgi:hypothetical protein
MIDDFEESLRETLGSVVPSPPDEPGRAAGAREYVRRARRTRAAVGVGIAAAVVTAVVAIPSVLGSSDHTADPAPSTPQPKPVLQLPPLAHPYSCPTDGHPAQYWSSPKRGLVPPGAVLARLCPDGPPTAGWTAPAEPLVTDVDALRDQVNGFPRTSVPTCPPARRVTYQVTFQYPDGHTVRVQAETGGCNVINVGSKYRLGASALLRDFLNRLHDQRAQYSPPPRKVTPFGCSSEGVARPLMVDGREPGLTRAMACSYTFPAGPNPTGTGTLSAEQVAQLNADLAAHATRQPRKTPVSRLCESLLGDAFVLVISGTDAWGDQIELSAQCSVFTFLDRNGTWYWTPTEQTYSMLWSVVHAVPHASGWVSGTLLGVGGPAPGAAFPWSGTVTLRATGAAYHTKGSAYRTTAGDDGRFEVSLPPGRYRVTGHSPSYNDGRTACNPLHPFVTVRPHRTARVNVFCQLR